MTTQYVTVEIGTQTCARGRVFNGRGLVRGYNGRWLGLRDDGYINKVIHQILCIQSFMDLIQLWIGVTFYVKSFQNHNWYKYCRFCV